MSIVILCNIDIADPSFRASHGLAPEMLPGHDVSHVSVDVAGQLDTDSSAVFDDISDNWCLVLVHFTCVHSAQCDRVRLWRYHDDGHGKWTLQVQRQVSSVSG